MDFKSYDLLHQKMGVIRTLMERCKTFMSEEADRAKERETTIKVALTVCDYPQWPITSVQNRIAGTEAGKEQNKKG